MSLTEAQAKAAVKAHWIAVMNPAIPVAFENTRFSEPSPPALWCAVQLMGVGSAQETLGALGQREYLRNAAVYLHVFDQVGSGTDAIYALIDTLRANWEGVSFGGIDPAGGAETRIVGGDELWYEVVLISPVQYTERK